MMNVGFYQKPGLYMKQSPQQVLLSTLLQLPILSLEQRIKLELEQNPLLEEDLEMEQEMEEELKLEELELKSDDEKGEAEDKEEEIYEEDEDENEIDWDTILNDENNYEIKAPREENAEEFSRPDVYQVTLPEHLLSQLNMTKLTDEEIKKIEKEVLSFDHDEIKEKIYQIGLWLGFDAETEKTISKGARVDVIWQAKIGNLGLVNYVFEVQKRGSIDGLILNLQKAKKNPTVQKLVVVSNKEQIEKLKNEVEDLDESFKRTLTYWEVEKVQRVYDNLSEITEIIDDLGLIQKEF